MSRRIVHVVGTGTIGEPLIGLLCNFKKYLGIDRVHTSTQSLLQYKINNENVNNII